MSVGGVLGDAWRLYRRYFWRGLLLAAPIFTVLVLPEAVVDSLHDTTWTVFLASLLVTLSTAYGDFVVEGVLVFVETPGAAVRRVRPRLFTLLGASLVYSLSFAAGLVVFVVPGLLVLAYGSVVVPVIMLEGLGVRAALARSARLVRGRFWPVFWVLVIILVVSAFVQTAFDNLLFWLPEFYASWVGHLLVSAVTAPFAAHALVVIYRRLVDFEHDRSS